MTAILNEKDYDLVVAAIAAYDKVVRANDDHTDDPLAAVIADEAGECIVEIAETAVDAKVDLPLQNRLLTDKAWDICGLALAIYQATLRAERAHRAGAGVDEPASRTAAAGGGTTKERVTLTSQLIEFQRQLMQMLRESRIRAAEVRAQQQPSLSSNIRPKSQMTARNLRAREIDLERWRRTKIARGWTSAEARRDYEARLAKLHDRFEVSNRTPWWRTR